MERKACSPRLWMKQRGWWILTTLVLIALCGGGPLGIFLSDAQAGACINLVDLLGKGGDESFALVNPPGFQIRMLPYETPSGVKVMGFPSVVDARQTGGWGDALFFGNISLAFDFGSVECVYLRFRYTGGSCYLHVNGQGRSFGSPREMEGTTLGGVRLSIYPAPNWSEGYLVLSGKIGRFLDAYERWASLIIGGQELAISELCVGR